MTGMNQRKTSLFSLGTSPRFIAPSLRAKKPSAIMMNIGATAFKQT